MGRCRLAAVKRSAALAALTIALGWAAPTQAQQQAVARWEPLPLHLSIPEARRAIRRYQEGEVQEGWISKYTVRRCVRLERNRAKCRVTESIWVNVTLWAAGWVHVRKTESERLRLRWVDDDS